MRSATDPAVDAETVDSMRSLQSRVFSGALSPSRLHIVRRIETPAPGGHVDTAVFSEPRANYDLTPLSTTEMTVTHARGSLADGTDTLKHIERLRFADQVVVVGGPANAPAGGTVTISDTTPRRGRRADGLRGAHRRQRRQPATLTLRVAGRGGQRRLDHGRTARDVHAR